MNQLTQENLLNLFSALRKIHVAHWIPPSLSTVKKEIDRVGKFVFRIGSNPWVAELIITQTSADYVINPELPERLKEQTKKLKLAFEQEILNTTI